MLCAWEGDTHVSLSSDGVKPAPRRAAARQACSAPLFHANEKSFPHAQSSHGAARARCLAPAPQQQQPARSSGHQLYVRHAVSCHHTNVLLDFSFSPGSKGLCWPTPPKPQNFLCLHLSLACSLPRSLPAHSLTLADSPDIATTCAQREGGAWCLAEAAGAAMASAPRCHSSRKRQIDDRVPHRARRTVRE